MEQSFSFFPKQSESTGSFSRRCGRGWGKQWWSKCAAALAHPTSMYGGVRWGAPPKLTLLSLPAQRTGLQSSTTLAVMSPIPSSRTTTPPFPKVELREVPSRRCVGALWQPGGEDTPARALSGSAAHGHAALLLRGVRFFYLVENQSPVSWGQSNRKDIVYAHGVNMAVFSFLGI